MNKYEQVITLGEGGYGRAILCRRKDDKALVVVKEVRLSSLSPSDREAAFQEAKLLSTLHHPFIVTYLESFQERGCLYITMEYADDGDLSKKISGRNGKLFTEEEVLKYFIQIALALKYIHDRKILHRDLKTQNIFLNKDGTVKLGDFGIAKVLMHTFQLCKTRIGTPYYLSPEICQGRNYNSKTDIWSLGCILYELCSLKHAFDATNINQLVMNIIKGSIPPVSSVYSAELRNLIESMLNKDPARRPRINEILALPFIKHRLQNYLSDRLLDYEMHHTVIRGRTPFAEGTIIPPKSKMDEEAVRKQQKQLMFEAAKKQRDYDKQAKILIQQKEEAQKLRLQKEHEEREKALLQEIEAKKRAKLASPTNRNDLRHNRPKSVLNEDFLHNKQMAQQNKARAQQNIWGHDPAFDFNYPDDEKPPHPKPQPSKPDEIDADKRRQIFLQQKEEAQRNRERIQREMNGENLKAMFEPSPPKARKKVPDSAREPKKSSPMKRSATPEDNDLKSLYKQNRREAAENKARIMKAMQGDVDLNKLINDAASNPQATEEKTRKKYVAPSPEFDEYHQISKQNRLEAKRNKERIQRELHELDMNKLVEESIQEQKASKGEPLIAEEKLSNVFQQANAIYEALEITGNEFQDESEDESKDSFFLPNKELHFPQIQDKDSISYRAEAIRAFLEREIGLDPMIALIHALEEDDSKHIVKNYEPGIIILVQQLIILDEEANQ